jgi:acyl-CoA thioesterase FadM
MNDFFVIIELRIDMSEIDLLGHVNNLAIKNSDIQRNR